jgi:hypothetical protein
MKVGFLVAAFFFNMLIWAKEPELKCEKKWGERTWQGMKFHRYHLRAEHFPPDKTYSLIVESFDGVRTEAFNFVSNKKGHLILVRPNDCQEEIYAICPAKGGERLTFWMKSADDAYGTQLVPFPLGMKSRKGAKLNLELLGEKGDKFLFTAEDLESYEEVKLFLVVQGQQIMLDPGGVTEYGELSTLIQLSGDLNGGEAKLILKTEREEVVFPFQWGVPALKIVGACCFTIK